MNRTYVLLDRDGTIIYDRHYLADPAGVELLPGAATGLRRLQQLGCGLIVVTNQSGIGRGYFDEPTLGRIHDRMRELLAAEHVTLDAIYFCPHTDDDACGCRKPQPGLATQAARDFELDLRRCYMVGDKCVDVELGSRVGATSILVRTGYGREAERQGKCRAEFVADDLVAVAEFVAAKIEDRGPK